MTLDEALHNLLEKRGGLGLDTTVWSGRSILHRGGTSSRTRSLLGCSAETGLLNSPEESRDTRLGCPVDDRGWDVALLLRFGTMVERITIRDTHQIDSEDEEDKGRN